MIYKNCNMKIRDKYKKIGQSGLFFMILLIVLAMQSYAQKDPEIVRIFDKYGDKQGVTLLEISDDLMKNYQIEKFRSIIFKDGSKALPEIRRLIDIDKENAKKIKESKENGLVISGYYRLKTDDEKMNRYLIFKVGKNNKVTLVYIEGKLTPEQLVELLK